eukprot:Mrub_00784.p1 GENE.Mrub_00784~~Mrub_00784.p1  ORF type:complete len:898 (+),score=64.89 Mrub_00784:149-2695(+)
MKEKNYFCITPKDLSTGGSGYVLYLQMIWYFSMVFLLMTLVSSGLLYKLWWIYKNAEKEFPETVPYSPKGILSVDVFSLGAVFNYISYDATSKIGGYDSLSDLIYWFMGTNLINSIIFLIAIIIWKNYSASIIDDVDDATLTPSDYTIRVFNIPVEAPVSKVKEIIMKISSDIRAENIHIAKRFDSRIQAFKNLITAAKTIKDLRTIKYRELTEKNPDKTSQEIIELIMDNNYVPESDYFSSYKSAFENFKNACSVCDKIEEEDRLKEGDGYNIDDFENVFAYVTFDHEKHAIDTLKKYLKAKKFRLLKDCLYCCFPAFPEEFTYKNEDGKNIRLELKQCDTEPGDINWENIGLSDTELFVNNFLFILMVVVVSLVSFIVIYFSQSYMNDLDVPVYGCAVVNNLYIRNNNHGLSPNLVKSSDITLAAYHCYVLDNTCNSNQCSAADNTNCATYIEYYQYANDPDHKYEKYCMCESYTADPGDDAMLKYEKTCEQQLDAFNDYTITSYIVTIITMVMNYVMLYTVLLGVPITRPVSKTEEEAKKTVWVFITQFANMSLIPVLVFATKEINYGWYQAVGLGILGNFFLYSITPNISRILSPWIKKYVLKAQGHLMAVDQEDFNNYMAGPNLLEYIYVGYSEFLTFVACCMIFSSSFPVLLPIGFIGLIIMYFVEKLSVTYYYKKVDWSSKLSQYTNDIYLYILAGNLLWTLWVFSNPYLFVYEKDLNQLNSDELKPAETATDMIFKFLGIQNFHEKQVKFLPFWVAFIALIVYQTFEDYILALFYYMFCCFLCIEIDEISGNEDIVTDKPYDPANMVTVVKSYDLRENGYYKRLIDAVQADDDYINENNM